MMSGPVLGLELTWPLSRFAERTGPICVGLAVICGVTLEEALVLALGEPSENIVKEPSVAGTLVQDLIDAGVHFGHRASRWNPKMRPYIYGRKNLVHIINVRETVRGLLRAKKYLRDLTADGGTVLFVGTKRQAAETIERESSRCGMPYVCDRWLGGTLTNFRTIRSRLGRLEELEAIRSSDEISTYSKKMQSALNREYRKMFRNLNGMRTMERIPNCVVVIDPKKERNAIREATKLGITTVALIDTDCDPDLVDLPIPGNDDGIRSIELIVAEIATAVSAGAAERATKQYVEPAATRGPAADTTNASQDAAEMSELDESTTPEPASATVGESESSGADGRG